MDTTATYDDYEEDDQSTLDLKVLLLYGAYRSKGRVLLFSLLGLAGGIMYAGSIPNMYQSVSQVKLLPDERGGMSPGQSMGLAGNTKPYMGPGIADHVNWLNEQEAVFQAVAGDLGPAWVLADSDPTMYDTPRTSPVVSEWHRLQKWLMHWRKGARVAYASGEGVSPLLTLAAVTRLRDHTILRATSEWVFTVTCLANSAEKAQEINYSITQGLIAADQSFRKGANQVLIEELTVKEQEAQAALDANAGSWQQWRLSCGVFNHASAEASNEALIDELASALGTKRSSMQGLTKSLEHTKEHYAAMPDTIQVIVPPVTNVNLLWVSLKEGIRETKLRLAELGAQSTTTVNRQTISALKLKLKALEEELSGEPQMIEVQPETLATVPNEAKSGLEIDIVEKEGDVEQLQIELQATEVRLKEAEGQRQKIAECKPGHNRFAQTHSLLTQAHEKVADRLQQAQAFGLLDVSELSNMRIWHEASLNPDKVKPQRSKPVLAGFGIGLALGLGLAVLRQLLDRRVRYPETVEKDLGLVMLGVVPELRRLRNQPKRRRSS